MLTLLSPSYGETLDDRDPDHDPRGDGRRHRAGALGAQALGVDRGLAVSSVRTRPPAWTVQENSDPTVKSDMLAHLRKLVPKDAGFAHAEDNSDAHIKCSMVGVSTTLIVESGRPQLGHWQAIFFCEFDGPRDRRLLVRVVPG
jgi:secondary thiamine-phosphate synthase enzyme